MSDTVTPTLPVEPVYLDRAELEAVERLRRVPWENDLLQACRELRKKNHPVTIIVRFDGLAWIVYEAIPRKRIAEK